MEILYVVSYTILTLVANVKWFFTKSPCSKQSQEQREKKCARGKEHGGCMIRGPISAPDFLCDFDRITLLIYMSICLTLKGEDLQIIICRAIFNFNTYDLVT